MEQEPNGSAAIGEGRAAPQQVVEPSAQRTALDHLFGSRPDPGRPARGHTYPDARLTRRKHGSYDRGGGIVASIA